MFIEILWPESGHTGFPHFTNHNSLKWDNTFVTERQNLVSDSATIKPVFLHMFNSFVVNAALYMNTKETINFWCLWL
jgi:hypothetical protein